ncbi:glycosyl hydrolase [Conexibacter stalactiti]|uniref:Glycosyl hydrolase n=1 Tax=Conexibacter stalactiti TaxID=1940611 RepID=A0ABU4HK68_9ACTN|nr:glycosyl hydrolase [Conexibacter stalactiti]MDW5593092.1 glycosyl hydrolase [Conexibacter stalactiti]MEC5033733.1 glycosyl hydrolase [Conexibacter stalactiti]
MDAPDARRARSGVRARRSLIGVAALVAVAAGPAPSTHAAPAFDVKLVDTPTLDQASFANPPMAVRPKYRWWMPRGATDPAELSAEIRAMKAAGAGGAEISPFAVPGLANTTGQGLQQNGWMSDAWMQRLTQMYETAAEEDFLLDDTMSGLGSDAISVPMPGAINAAANSKRYVTGYTLLTDGASYDGALPTTANVTFSTALCAPAQAGATQILPVITRSLSVGDTITVGTGVDAETARVAQVGDGSWGCGRTFTASAAGDSRIFVSYLAGGGGQDSGGGRFTQFNIGQRVVVGSGVDAETVTVKSIGRAPSAAPTTLAAPVNAGDATARVASASTIAVGRYVLLDGQLLRVKTVGVGGDARTIEFETPIARAAAAGAPVQDLGEGIEVTPLNKPHGASEDVVVDAPQGRGIALEAPLQRAHGLTDPVTSDARKTLVAALAVKCADRCAEAPKLLDPRATIDVTQDAADGTIDDLAWRTPGTWVVYVQQMVNDPAFQKGAFSPLAQDYPVDHLSGRGARALIDYWDANVLTPRIRAAIAKNRGGLQTLFEDSLEMPFTPKWTGDFLQEWEARRGYDLTPLLPALSGTNQQARPSGSAANQFAFQGLDVERVREDYRQTWSDLFIERFVSPIQRWAQKQGLGGRFQLYGSFPIDTSAASSVVSNPEAESLGFGNDPHAYTIVATGAHMSGTDVVSNECCAANGQTYRAQVADKQSPLQQIYQAFAGGVTQQMWHGFDYKTSAIAKWPGYHAWSPEGITSSFSEAFGPRMPVWGSGGIKAVNDNVARLSLVLRQGSPRYDLAVYNQVFGAGTFQGPQAPTIRPNGPLAQSGLSMEFLSPDYLVSDARRIWDGRRLFPDNSSYRALVLNRQETMAPDVARRIVSLVEDGMPLLVIGGLPSRAAGLDPGGVKDRSLARAMGRLGELIAEGRNAGQVADESGAAAALHALGVRPSAEKAQPSTTLTVRRAADGVDYYYLYNNSDAPITDVWTFEGEGRPFRLDAWSGKIVGLGSYEAGPQGVTVPLTIGARDVAVIAVAPEPPGSTSTPKDHVVAADGDAVERDNGTIGVRSTQNGPVSATLASGKVVTGAIEGVPAARVLNRWSLRLESWQPGPDPTSDDYDWMVDKVDRGTFEVAASGEDPLPSWRRLVGDSSLDFVSGIGAYTTTVDLPESAWTGGHGAYLALGETNDSVRLTVNGHDVPVSLQDLSRIDIGPFLRGGANTIEVKVASTLNNVANRTNVQDYGLLGPVRLTPYGETTVVGPVAPTATSAPVVSGTLKVGETLRATDGIWDVTDLSFAHQWLRDGQPIPGATGLAYTLTSADADHRMAVTVTASGPDYQDARSTSEQTALVAPADRQGGGGAPNGPSAPNVTMPPTISGTAMVGRTLSTSNGVWTVEGLTFGYQWKRDGKPIAGATKATYRVAIADAGRTLSVDVTASKAGLISTTVAARPISVRKLAATLSWRLKAARAKVGMRVGAVARVRVSGIARPTGVLRVLDGHKVVTVKTLRPRDRGSLTFRLPKLARGKHKLTLSYGGSPAIRASRSKPISLVVRR